MSRPKSTESDSSSICITKMSRILYLSGFVDFLGVSMIMPLVLPQARELGASPTLAGAIGSVYGGLQLFSSPIIGKWSDTVSRQFSLAVCLLMSGLGYASLGIYSSLAVLFVGRLVLGCFKHSQTITKAFLADVLPKESLTGALGSFNSFSSIGFILGPIIGGHLAETKGGFTLVAFVAGAIFVCNAVLVWWAIPTNFSASHHHSSSKMIKEDSSTSLKKLGSDEIDFSFSKMVKSFREFDWIELWDLFLIKFLAGFSVIIFRTNFTMVLKQKFDASPKTLGYLTSYSGVVATLSGFILGKVTQKYKSNAKLFLHVTVLQVLTLMCLTWSSSLHLLLIFLMPLSFVTCISRVSSTTLTISRCGDSAVGSIMGLSQSVMAVARMIAPFIAGLAQEFSIDGASYISILAAAFSVILMLCRPQCPQVRKEKLS